MPLIIQTICALLLVILLLAALRVPVGTFMYKTFTDKKHNPVEKVIYKLIGVNPDNEMRWTSYAIASIAFGVFSVLILWVIIMAQGMLPWAFGLSLIHI